MIRQLSVDDLTALMIIENECFSDPYKEKQYVYEFEDNPCAYLFGYFKDDELVGFIDFWITFESVQLCKIAVKKTFQNKHIGKTLMDYMFDFCLNQNCEYVFLEVRSQNKLAKSFYEKADFYELNIRKDYYHDPFDDGLVMGKVLVGLKDE